MSISIAMCTYNGARYVEEQLDSIINQTLPPNEIVVCDDGSTDDTAGIVEKILRGWGGDIASFRMKRILAM